jgi:hypothetical protein
MSGSTRSNKGAIMEKYRWLDQESGACRQDELTVGGVTPQKGELRGETPLSARPTPAEEHTLAVKIEPKPHVNVRRRVSDVLEEDPGELLPSTVTVTACDESNHRIVDGEVLIDGQVVGRTGAPFTHTFVTMTWFEPSNPSEHRRPRVKTHRTRVHVRARGFPLIQVSYKR